MRSYGPGALIVAADAFGDTLIPGMPDSSHENIIPFPGSLGHEIVSKRPYQIHEGISTFARGAG